MRDYYRFTPDGFVKLLDSKGRANKLSSIKSQEISLTPKMVAIFTDLGLIKEKELEPGDN